GSKIPLGANRVIIQENCKITNKSEITAKINNRDELYIRKKGQDFKKGALILKKKHRVNSRDIGLLVTSGIKKVLVFKKPNIAIIATGNELINIDKKIGKGQIYASSLYMLKELVNACDSTCKELIIIKDNEISIKNNISNLKKMDLVITTGGVSVGKKDLVKKCLEDLGMKTKFWKVKVKPGKPILFGLLNGTPVFGLPGNPVSSYVCFIIFVMEAIKKLLPSDATYIIKSKAQAVSKFINNSERETYYRGSFFTKNNKKYVNIFKNQDSSLMKNLSLANCLVKVPAKKTALKGDFLEIYELNSGL
ncbi:molybdopterin molybdotransferase MoeA, partial [Alphaproteobacteria bacterium]|nr:molybdopterin molybdotransferase MoeA [Alphaproteobacteria bacterium]